MLSRQFYLFIKIHNKIDLLKNIFYKLFLILTPLLLLYSLSINTTLGYFLEGGFNIIVVILNVLFLILYTILFLYFYKKQRNDEDINNFNFYILRNSFKENDDNYNFNNKTKIRLISLISSIFPSLYAFVIAFIILGIDYNLISSILSLVLIVTISFLTLLFLYIFIFTYNEKNKLFKKYKLILSYVVKLFIVSLLVLIIFYYKKYYFIDIFEKNDPNPYVIVFAFSLFSSLIFFALNLFLSPINYFDDSYIRYLVKRNNNNNN